MLSNRECTVIELEVQRHIDVEPKMWGHEHKCVWEQHTCLMNG